MAITSWLRSMNLFGVTGGGRRRREFRRRINHKSNVEDLEPRQMLTYGAFATLDGGDFLIQGTNADDTITVNTIGDQVLVIIDTPDSVVVETAPLKDVDSLTIYGLNGADHVDVDVEIPTVAVLGAGSNTYYGSNAVDVVFGGSSKDWIYTYGGDDIVFAGDGGDYVSAGTGDDELFGGDGDDELFGSDGFDTIKGEAGDDTIAGGDDDDFLYGNSGNDSIKGGDGRDYLDGSSGEDTLHGMDGIDSIRGGNHDDSITGGNGGDFIEGVGGNDTIRGDGGDDEISGGNDKDKIYGGDGDDLLYGNGADDVIYGDADKDTLYGGTNNDKLYGGNNKDALYGESGDDELYGQNGADKLRGGKDNDLLDGGAAKDELKGEDGDDVLRGIFGEDSFLEGGNGTDRLEVIVDLTQTASTVGPFIVSGGANTRDVVSVELTVNTFANQLDSFFDSVREYTSKLSTIVNFMDSNVTVVSDILDMAGKSGIRYRDVLNEAPGGSAIGYLEDLIDAVDAIPDQITTTIDTQKIGEVQIGGGFVYLDNQQIQTTDLAKQSWYQGLVDVGFEIPALTNPGLSVALLIDPTYNTDFVTFELPDINVEKTLAYEHRLKSLGLISVEIGGILSFKAERKFALDKLGVYVNNVSADLSAGIYVQGALDLLLVEAGVEGELVGTISIEMVDPTGFARVGSGSIFQASGKLNYEVGAYIERWSIQRADWVKWKPDALNFGGVIDLF
jgi:Ca2+-binding RTX toxin-like protein